MIAGVAVVIAAGLVLALIVGFGLESRAARRARRRAARRGGYVGRP